jgi:predicted methyltransferase
MRKTFLIAAVAIVLAGCGSKPAENPKFSQAALDRALADPARAAQREAADARRKPGPLIALAGSNQATRCSI